MAQIFGKWLKDHSVNNQKIDNNDTYTVKGLVVDPLGVGGVAIGLPHGTDALHIKRIGNAGIRLDSSRSYRLVSDTGGNFDIIDTSSSIIRLQINPQGQIATNGSLLIDQTLNAPALTVRELNSASTATVVKIDNTGSGKFLTANSNGVENFSISATVPQVSLLTSGGTYLHINATDHGPAAVRLQSNAASFFSMESYDSSMNPQSNIRIKPNEVDINTISGNSSIVLADTTVSIAPAGTPNIVSTVNGVGINVPDPQVALDVFGNTDISGNLLITALDSGPTPRGIHLTSSDLFTNLYVSVTDPADTVTIQTPDHDMTVISPTGMLLQSGSGMINIQPDEIVTVNVSSPESVVMNFNGLGIGGGFGVLPQCTIDATSQLPQPIFNGYRVTDTDPDILMTLSSGFANGPNTVFQIDASGRTSMGTAFIDPGTKLALYNKNAPTNLRLVSDSDIFGNITQWNLTAGAIEPEDLLIRESLGFSTVYIRGKSHGAGGNLTIGVQNTDPQACLDMTSAFDFPIFNGHRPTDTDSDILFTLNSGAFPQTVFQVNAGGDTSVGGDLYVSRAANHEIVHATIENSGTGSGTGSELDVIMADATTGIRYAIGLGARPQIGTFSDSDFKIVRNIDPAILFTTDGDDNPQMNVICPTTNLNDTTISGNLYATGQAILGDLSSAHGFINGAFGVAGTLSANCIATPTNLNVGGDATINHNLLVLTDTTTQGNMAVLGKSALNNVILNTITGGILTPGLGGINIDAGVNFVSIAADSTLVAGSDALIGNNLTVTKLVSTRSLSVFTHTLGAGSVYYVQDVDTVILCTPDANNVTIYLPVAAQNPGRILAIKNLVTTTHNIIVNTQFPPDQIETPPSGAFGTTLIFKGDSPFGTTNVGGSIILVSDGVSKWCILANVGAQVE